MMQMMGYQPSNDVTSIISCRAAPMRDHARLICGVLQTGPNWFSRVFTRPTAKVPQLD